MATDEDDAFAAGQRRFERRAVGLRPVDEVVDPGVELANAQQFESAPAQVAKAGPGQRLSLPQGLISESHRERLERLAPFSAGDPKGEHPERLTQPSGEGQGQRTHTRRHDPQGQVASETLESLERGCHAEGRLVLVRLGERQALDASTQFDTRIHSKRWLRDYSRRNVERS